MKRKNTHENTYYAFLFNLKNTRAKIRTYVSYFKIDVTHYRALCIWYQHILRLAVWMRAAFRVTAVFLALMWCMFISKFNACFFSSKYCTISGSRPSSHQRTLTHTHARTYTFRLSIENTPILWCLVNFAKVHSTSMKSQVQTGTR